MRNSLKRLLRHRIKHTAITCGMEAAWLFSKLGLTTTPARRGVIFTLHHVRPKTAASFDPNGHLEVTPEFLDAAIGQLRDDGYRFVSLDAVPALLHAENDAAAPFAAFTLDDGYRNNAEHGAPVFSRNSVPFTVFVAGGFAERTHSIWWETAAALLTRLDRLRFDFGSGLEDMPLKTVAQKYRCFERLAETIIGGREAEMVARLDQAARDHDFDPLALTRDLTMDAGELRALLANPLATLGAHTISHRALAYLDDAAARTEMRASADYLEAVVGRRPTSIAYPYGHSCAASVREQRLATELGFKIAVTTTPGTLSPALADRITGLPRISLNGFYQKPRYASALASGIPFRLMGLAV